MEMNGFEKRRRATEEQAMIAGECCFHCREIIIGPPVTHESKKFCCRGCRSVYMILSDQDMLTYYALNEGPGISQRNKKTSDYQYLDELDNRDLFVDFTDDRIEKARFHVPQVHCSSCLWLLEHLHQLDPRILSARVHFVKQTVSITYQHAHIRLSEVAALLARLGYPPQVSLRDRDTRMQDMVGSDHRLVTKIGVAGFAFGNIMLFSFPEYLGLSGQDGDLSKIFSFLNLVLAIPVLGFCASDILKSAWRGITMRQLNMNVPLSLGILTIFLRSLYEILTMTGEGYLDSFAGLVFFLLIGRWFQQKTHATISFDRDYRSYFPISSLVLEQGEEFSRPLEKLKIGDTIKVRNGDLIPADGILESEQAYIDYSFVSGEAELIKKSKREKVFAGGRVQGVSARVILTRSVSGSYLIQLWNDDAEAGSVNPGPVSQISDRMASAFTITIIAIATLTGVYWLQEDPSKAAFAATSVLIIACPCAIALSIPFTLGEGIRLLGTRSIFVRDLSVLEKLTEVSQFIFDKTGTLTDSNRSRAQFDGQKLSRTERSELSALVAQSSHPVSREIYRYLNTGPAGDVQSVVEHPGVGIEGRVNGNLLELKSSQFNGGKQGDTTLLVNGSSRGKFMISRQYRKGLGIVVDQLSKTHTLSLLSGDHDAEKLVLKTYFPSETTMLFRQSPMDKQDFVAKCQAGGQKVAMIGDGLNDSGALRQSDVGIAIASDHTAFAPASDIIISEHAFEDISRLVEFSTKSIWVVKVCYAIAILYNIVGLSYAVSASLSPLVAAILMPLSSVSIVIVGVALERIVFRWIYVQNHDPI